MSLLQLHTGGMEQANINQGRHAWPRSVYSIRLILLAVCTYLHFTLSTVVEPNLAITMYCKQVNGYLCIRSFMCALQYTRISILRNVLHLSLI